MKTEGLRSFYRGAGVNAVKMVPGAAVQVRSPGSRKEAAAGDERPSRLTGQWPDCIFEEPCAALLTPVLPMLAVHHVRLHQNICDRHGAFNWTAPIAPLAQPGRKGTGISADSWCAMYRH